MYALLFWLYYDISSQQNSHGFQINIYSTSLRSHLHQHLNQPFALSHVAMPTQILDSIISKYGLTHSYYLSMINPLSPLISPRVSTHLITHVNYKYCIGFVGESCMQMFHKAEKGQSNDIHFHLSMFTPQVSLTLTLPPRLF